MLSDEDIKLTGEAYKALKRLAVRRLGTNTIPEVHREIRRMVDLLVADFEKADRIVESMKNSL